VCFSINQSKIYFKEKVMTDITIEKPISAVIDAKQQRQDVVAYWKTISSGKIATALDTAYYIVLRSLVTKQETPLDDTISRLEMAFGPVTNHVKLENGRYAYDTLDQLLYRLSYMNNGRGFPMSDALFDDVKQRIKDIRYELDV
jgi:hypothetical protein